VSMTMCHTPVCGSYDARCLRRACELELVNFFVSPARQVSVPFYRAKGTIYKVRFMDDLHCKALGGLHRKAHGRLAL
jgi:hypothetical protein